ncbi:MAG: WcaF family extracellular polysaccharide biosynthesis acetyltransferase [Planctomycetaceae bacterium]|nr:WcaF family extracellular polysaccharide biosynthesis acetyltransferase [Planctomycetaceae bacterium]
MQGKVTARLAETRDLSRYTSGGYSPGRSAVIRIIWYACSLLFFESGLLPLSGPKRILLRLFGARIGKGAVIKPHVRIKYPWKLTVGNHVWIGEEAWLDNLAPIEIGDHVCLSQRVYLCTGSHDDSSPTFDLKTTPIVLEEGCWIAANATVLGGVTVGTMATVCAGSVVTKSLPGRQRYGGVPARPLQ